MDELVEHFTLMPDELALPQGKAEATPAGLRLAWLKFLIWAGRFPRDRGELPDESVQQMARQVGVPGGLYRLL